MPLCGRDVCYPCSAVTDIPLHDREHRRRRLGPFWLEEGLWWNVGALLLIAGLAAAYIAVALLVPVPNA